MSSGALRRLHVENVLFPRLREGRDQVTLTYDWPAVPRSIREYLHFPPFGPEHLTNSLRHLAELATPASRA